MEMNSCHKWQRTKLELSYLFHFHIRGAERW